MFCDPREIWMLQSIDPVVEKSLFDLSSMIAGMHDKLLLLITSVVGLTLNMNSADVQGRLALVPLN